MITLKKINTVVEQKSILYKSKFKDVIIPFLKEPKPEKWVFITGCYNSGTTLLHEILAMHAKVGSTEDT